MLRTFRRDWSSNICGDLLPVLVVAFALIPEAINLAVMGAYGHLRIRQFFIGSQTTRMLRISITSLLLLRWGLCR